jgi:hypothetical protein
MHLFNSEETLTATHDHADEKACNLIHAFLKKGGRVQPHTINPTPLWPADFFHLDKSSLFQRSPIEEQYQILSYCTQDLLNESYFIEKIGIAYAAKLVLLSPSTEAKQLFSFIGADEATHLEWILPYIPEAIRTQPTGPLLALITQITQLNNANLLYYLVQIILEGWGLKHYKSLSQYCLDPYFKTILDRILQDEALHHHSGKILFSSDTLTAPELYIIKDTLKAYCDLVRVGPQAVIKAVDKVKGGLSRKTQIELFNDLEGEQSAKEKLDLLFKLMNQPGLEKIVQELCIEGYFTPYAATSLLREILPLLDTV